MYHEMKRKKQALSEERCIEILKSSSYGVLSLCDGDGEPYGVPLNFVWHEGKVYFHCAHAGHKIDAAEATGRASFCVVDRSDIVTEEYTTYFRSVIVSGKIAQTADETVRQAAMTAMVRRLTPEDIKDKAGDIAGGICRANVLELTPEHITGKESLDMMNARAK